MAIALVRSNATSSAAASPVSITPNLGVASAAGNLLILAVVVTGTTPSITAPGGNWQQITNAVTNGVANALFIQPNNAGGVTSQAVTVASTGGGAAAMIAEYSGTGPTVTTEAQGVNSATSNAASTATLTQLAGEGELLFCCLQFAAATINSTTNTPEWSSAFATAVSTNGVPNAQLACFWGVSQVTGVPPKVQAALNASVVWIANLARLNCGNSHPTTYCNVGGNAGVYVGQFNQGTIGG